MFSFSLVSFLCHPSFLFDTIIILCSLPLFSPIPSQLRSSKPPKPLYPPTRRTWESNYFGVPLQNLVTSDRPIPLFIDKCVDYIERTGESSFFYPSLFCCLCSLSLRLRCRCLYLLEGTSAPLSQAQALWLFAAEVLLMSFQMFNSSRDGGMRGLMSVGGREGCVCRRIQIQSKFTSRLQCHMPNMFSLGCHVSLPGCQSIQVHFNSRGFTGNAVDVLPKHSWNYYKI